MSAISAVLLLALGGCGTQAQMVSSKVYTQIAAGDAHACALVSDGTVECWGWNNKGQLGNGATYGDSLLSYNLRLATGQPGDGSSIPATVPGLSGVTAISAKGNQTCALLRGGAVKCWGRTSQVFASSVPVTVTGLMGAATAISVGSPVHTCALLSSGVVQCWGWNDYGQLGNGTTAKSNMPVTVTGLAGATAISAGFQDTCALIRGGTVKCWGLNDFGQLGNGITTGLHSRERGSNIISSTPVTVVGLKGATAISAGSGYTCALLGDSAVQCWGDADSSRPVTVTGLRGAIAISVGSGHTCAVLSGGTVRCWGGGGYGQLGNGAFDDSETPVTVTGLTGATAISAGRYFSCAIRSDGSIWCWGSNQQGELGDGTFATDRGTAARIRN